MSITLTKTDAEIAECFSVMAQLRPHLEAAQFVDRVRRMEREGFQLAALRENGQVEAVAGFRIYENLVTGRQMYVDDLVTNDATRSHGHGKTLLTWLAEFAKADGCLAIELDSGTHRKEAHRFYFRERMAITAFHFIRRLTADG
jgi:GNAT superfamily N-acetyltransferase